MNSSARVAGEQLRETLQEETLVDVNGVLFGLENRLFILLLVVGLGVSSRIWHFNITSCASVVSRRQGLELWLLQSRLVLNLAVAG
jgi:hypothetical protein